MSNRLGLTKKAWTGENASENVTLKPRKLSEPYALKEPSRIFVNSMSDLYHKEIPDTFIAEVFKVMHECPQHVFQILTKRPRRAAKYPGPWTDNIWQGTSIESRKYLYRIDQLRECPANVRCSYRLNPCLKTSAKSILTVYTGSSLAASRAKATDRCRMNGQETSVTNVLKKGSPSSSNSPPPTAPNWVRI